ncbi:MAG: M3 family metallopeptidase, partial [Planctomycetota bacterium]
MLLPALLALASGLQAESPIQAGLDAADATLESLIAVPAEERTVANTLIAIDDAMALLTESARMTAFMAEVSPDADVRSTGREAQSDITNWYNRLAQNEDIFRAVLELEALEPEMTAIERRFFDQTLRDFRRAGFELADEERARLAEIDETLSDLGAEFRKNVAEDETLVFFTEEELRGVPESYLKTLKRSGDLLQVSMRHPSLYYVLGYCEVDLSRQKMGAAASMRGGAANVRVLEKLLKLRHERANLLGYANPAEYVLETKMAQTPEVVMAFYEDLAPKVRKKAARDFAEIEAAKREHTGDPEAKLL